MQIESERITNIAELEKLIQEARADIIHLKNAIKSGNTDVASHLAEKIDLNLHQMAAFDFAIERRTVTVKDNGAQNELDEIISKIYGKIKAGNGMTGQEVDMVNALAKLVLARAFADYSSKFCADSSPIKDS